MRIFAPQTNLFRDIKSAKLYIAFFFRTFVLSYFLRFYAFTLSKARQTWRAFFVAAKIRNIFQFLRANKVFFSVCVFFTLTTPKYSKFFKLHLFWAFGVKLGADAPASFVVCD